MPIGVRRSTSTRSSTALVASNFGDFLLLFESGSRRERKRSLRVRNTNLLSCMPGVRPGQAERMIICRTMAESFVNAFAAIIAGGPLEPWSFERGALGPQEVDIDVTHCGVCHTDLHLLDNDFGITAYPFVPGHEAVGLVKATGSDVTHLTLGQRVGVGWQRGSCGECEWCGRGLQNLCAKSHPTCLAGYGGFAKSLRVDSYFGIPIPDGLDSASAAPMLCAGITVYSPLRRYLRPASRVGIVGIGGLGHLAIQFARAMGAEVTAISTTQDKAAEARRFGAHHFVTSTTDIPNR